MPPDASFDRKDIIQQTERMKRQVYGFPPLPDSNPRTFAPTTDAFMAFTSSPTSTSTSTTTITTFTTTTIFISPVKPTTTRVMTLPTPTSQNHHSTDPFGRTNPSSPALPTITPGFTPFSPTFHISSRPSHPLLSSSPFSSLPLTSPPSPPPPPSSKTSVLPTITSIHVSSNPALRNTTSVFSTTTPQPPLTVSTSTFRSDPSKSSTISSVSSNSPVSPKHTIESLPMASRPTTDLPPSVTSA
ncbi:hypothetical protein Clacol_008041 [Clathrus columnatus]|uniref:Uncharacterized protein n=1 Tax=Clathrus columnatus TaxID=1419009 RepID=A0AAV5AGL3_9AGAM|nr:hypothetical protein Clacol_008041 [Clathrus columnatus]